MDSSRRELAPRPKPERPSDPCGCAPDNPDAILNPTEHDMCCRDDSCINFATLEECRGNCLAGAACANKRLQNRDFASPVVVFDAGPEKGMGLKITKPIQASDIVHEYTGRAICGRVLHKLLNQSYSRERRLYIMALSDGVYLDARRAGSLARFINHSCSPNCKVERWKVRGVMRAAVNPTDGQIYAASLTQFRRR